MKRRSSVTIAIEWRMSPEWMPVLEPLPDIVDRPTQVQRLTASRQAILVEEVPVDVFKRQFIGIPGSQEVRVIANRLHGAEEV